MRHPAFPALPGFRSCPWGRPGVALASLALGLACGGGAGGTAPAPAALVITSFNAGASTVAAGSGTTLTPVFTGGSGTVAPGPGPVASGVAVATGPLSANTTFTLTVSDAAGTSVARATTVAVVAGPVIAAQPQSLTVTLGQPAPFQVTATGLAPLAYQWLRDGTAIAGATSAAYASQATTAADGGAQYSVTVSNSLGKVTSGTATVTLAAAPAPVAVSVSGAATGLRLASGFAGFSYEKNRVDSALFGSADTGLVALFQRLGPGLLRVGGNSVDQETWTPGGAGLTAGQIAPADVDRLAAFLRAANWKVIYGINFATNTQAGMAAEAAYAASSLGDRLFGFELGNEPDLYHGNGLRPTTYTFADFLAEWQGYAAAILAQVPAAPLTGPASAGSVSSFTAPFAAAAGARIGLLTQHYYRANGENASSTIGLLLSPDPNLPGELQTLKGAAASISHGYRLAEANSFYDGGAPDVSDAYGTALWAIDFLFGNALNGGTGVNFHGGGDGPGYTPIADNGSSVVEARPEYYGMDLVTLAGPGALLGTTVAPGALAFSAYAVAADAGPTMLVLVNKDPGQVAKVAITLPAAASSATLTTLAGTGLNSTTGTTLDGVPINPDGSWTPPAAVPVAVSGTSLTLTLAPASAVLARIE